MQSFMRATWTAGHESGRLDVYSLIGLYSTTSLIESGEGPRVRQVCRGSYF